MLKLYPFLFFVAMAETWEKTLCKSYIRSFYTLASRQMPMRSLSLNTELATSLKIGNSDNYFYYVEIQIGTPPQSFYVQLDTGSSVQNQINIPINNQILWVPSIDCYLCEMKIRFNQTISTSYVDYNETFTIQYGEGECSGVFGQDVVAMVGTQMNAPMELLFVNQMKQMEYPKFMSGIMGLSNWDKYSNIFQEAYKAGQILSDLYGFQLNQSPNQSYLLYDQFSQEVLDNTPWVSTVENYKWEIDVLGVYLNNQDYTKEIRGYHKALIDSGTTCIIIDQNLYNAIWNDFFKNLCAESEEGITCPCNPKGNEYQYFPNITFFTRGAILTIPYLHYLQQQSVYLNSSKDTCTLCFSVGQSGYMIFGDPVIQAFTSIFDKSNQMIGFYGQLSIYQKFQSAETNIVLNFYTVLSIILGGQIITLITAVIYIVFYIRNKDQL